MEFDSLEPTPGAHQSHVAGLTGFRGVAALSVVLVHTSTLSPYSWLGLHGFGPVALFVLSGYLLIRPWSKAAVSGGRPPSLRTFAIRRSLRIFPPYLCCLFLVALLIPASQPRGWADWGRAVTLTTMYEGYLGLEAMVHTWSLGTELSWYLVLPLMGASVLAVSRRRGRRALPPIAMAVFGVFVLVTVVWRWRMGAGTDIHHPQAATWLPAWLACFAMGAAVSHLLTLHRAGVPSRLSRALAMTAANPVLLPLAGLLCVVVANSPSLAGGHKFEPTSSLQANTGMAANVLLALVLLVGLVFAAETSALARVMGSAPLVSLGRWSFGIYLANLPLVYALSPLWPHADAARFVLWVAAITTLSVLAGAAVFALVERPSIDLGRRVTQNSS